jgi:RimJ/RimL family protein N-acetyltransferase
MSTTVDPGAWPGLTLYTITSRVTLVHPPLASDAPHYAALLNHPSISEYLPPFRSYIREPITIDGAAALLESHRLDASRLGFSLWLSHQDGENDPRYLGTAGLTRIGFDATTGLKHGEAGLLLSPSAQSTGLVSEVMLAVLSLGFGPSPDSAPNVPWPLGTLDRITFGTSNRNSRLRYWIENVLSLTPLPDEALSAAQKSDRGAWGEDALVFYHLYRDRWEAQGGQRDILTQRIMQRSQREVKRPI